MREQGGMWWKREGEGEGRGGAAAAAAAVWLILCQQSVSEVC